MVESYAVLTLSGWGLCIAYLDPASGSMLLQVLLGGLAGAAVALKLGWRHITQYLAISLLRKNRKAEASDAAKIDEVTPVQVKRRAA
jgi:hypothetical protein